VITARKILAQAAASRAGRDLLAHYNELVDNASIGNLLTVRTTHRSTGQYCPEIDLLDYDCDMPAPQLRKLARARFEARMEGKRIRRARYQRRHGQWCSNVYAESWPHYAARTGLSGYRGTAIIMDDPAPRQAAPSTQTLTGRHMPGN
jgi:hypothetical protein